MTISILVAADITEADEVQRLLAAAGIDSTLERVDAEGAAGHRRRARSASSSPPTSTSRRSPPSRPKRRPRATARATTMAGELVRLTSASSGPEAEMITGLLENAGIRA